MVSNIGPYDEKQADSTEKTKHLHEVIIGKLALEAVPQRPASSASAPQKAFRMT